MTKKTTTSGTPVAINRGGKKTRKNPEFSFLYDSYLEMPNSIPFNVLKVIDVISTYNSDVSLAVSLMTNLINSGMSVQCKKSRNTKFITELLYNQINKSNGGIIGLLQNWATQLYVYGACTGEIIISPNFDKIEDVICWDTKTARFKDKSENKRVLCQLSEGGDLIELPEYTCFYFSNTSKNDNPYGISPILPCVPVSVQQEKFMKSYEKALDKISIWGQVVGKYDVSKNKRKTDETEEEYVARINADIEKISKGLQEKSNTDPIITTQNVDLKIEGGVDNAGNIEPFVDILNESITNSLKMQKSMLGKNDVNTELYGTVQYRMILRQVKSAQNILAKIIEKICNVAFDIYGIKDVVTVSFNENEINDYFKQTQGDFMKIRGLQMLLECGVIDSNKIAEELGYGEAVINMTAEDFQKDDRRDNLPTEGGVQNES